MSKAFTREDDVPDPVAPRKLTSPLPAGASNYLTANGAERLRAELQRLVEIERPKLAESEQLSGQESVQMQAVEQRIQYLQRSLQSAVIVHPSDEPLNQVR